MFVAAAADQVVEEVRSRFPAHGLMDALGMVYPQYWKNGDPQALFRKHLDVIKAHFGESRSIGTGDDKILVPALLDARKLESEQHLFRVSMVHNSAYACELPPMGSSTNMVNPLTKLWRCLDSNSALAGNFQEYIKLAQIAMVQVLGSVEDERTFSSLSFLKDKLRNRLDNSHLALVVGMHAQDVYTLEDFPYDACFKQWVHSAEWGRYGTTV